MKKLGSLPETNFEEKGDYDKDVRRIPIDDIVFDVKEYAVRRLPTNYPLGGLNTWKKIGLSCHLWYGGEAPSSMRTGDFLRSEILHVGSGRHREYRLRIWERPSGEIIADFDSILGHSRWIKLQLLLRSVGIPGSVMYRHRPRGEKEGAFESAELDRDFEKAPSEVDLIVVGGLNSGVREAARSRGYSQIGEGGGNAVRWELVRFSGREILLTSYPYGTLAEWLGRRLRELSNMVFFIGSCGSLTPELARGDIVLPTNVRCITGWTKGLRNCLNGANTDPRWVTSQHLTVHTPLEETGQLVSRAVRAKWSTADCELGWLHKGLASGSGGEYNGRFGAALFVTDEAWRARKGVTHLSYRHDHIRDAIEECANHAFNHLKQE